MRKHLLLYVSTITHFSESTSSNWELSFVRIPCCDCIVAHPADRQHIVPSYLKITQNDKFSVKVEPFTGNPLCHPL